MRFFLVIIVLVVASTADARLLSKSGMWRADTGSAAGQTACLLSAQFDDGRIFGLKMLDDTGEAFYIQLNKRGWDIPEKTKVEITVLFTPDAARGFGAKDLSDAKMSLTGIGFAQKNGSPGSDVIIPIPNAFNFMDTFLRSAKMIILFPKGGEEPWVFDTAEQVLNVTKSFIDCAREHRDTRRAPTQPHRY